MNIMYREMLNVPDPAVARLKDPIASPLAALGAVVGVVAVKVDAATFF